MSDKNKLIIEALMCSQAYIEFDPTGIILDANKNFLNCLGYDS